MRRFVMGTVAVAVSLALAGPVAGEEASGPAPSSPGPSRGPTIGFTNYWNGHIFFGEVLTGARRAADAAGVELLVVDAQGEPAVQASQIDAFTAAGVDAIVVVPIDGAVVAPAVEAARAAGIPVVAVDRAVDGGAATSLVASDNVAGARMAAEYLFEAMGGSGSVVEIQGDMAVSSGADRSAGFQAALDEAPGITRALQESAYFDYGMARGTVQRALIEDPGVGGVFAANGDMLEGAAAAVAAADTQGEVRVVGFDTSASIIAGIRDGDIDATVAQQPRLMGQKAVEAAIAAASGETIDPIIAVETILVTADNVDEVAAR